MRNACSTRTPEVYAKPDYTTLLEAVIAVGTVGGIRLGNPPAEPMFARQSDSFAGD
jgi:hypothetical protein